MPPPLTMEEVQQWLNNTKLDFSNAHHDVDWETLAEESRAQVFGRLSKMYNVAAWTVEEEPPLDPDDPPVVVNKIPPIVRSVMSMLTASWVYSRAFAESVGEGGNEWADYLRALAESIIQEILDGTIVLDDLLDGMDVPGSPSFFPQELTGSTQQYDGAGNPVGDAFGADRKFHMGKVF